MKSDKAIILDDYSYKSEYKATSSITGTISSPYDLRQYAYIRLMSAYDRIYTYVNPNALVIIDQSERSIHCNFFFKVVKDTEGTVENNSNLWVSVGEDGGWKGILQFLGSSTAIMITETNTQGTIIGGQTGKMFPFNYAYTT